MIEKKRYWLYFEPYVYICLKKQSVLLYNTLDGNHIIECEKDILSLVRQLVNPINCGVILLDLLSIESNSILTFIYRIREKYMGDIIAVDLSLSKPILPLPLVLIKDKLKKDIQGSRGIEGIDVLKFLSDINLYLFTSCRNQCHSCNLIHRQIPSCMKTYKKYDINESINVLAIISKFILKSSYKGILSIFAGDFIKFRDNLERINHLLNPIKNRCRIYCHINNIDNLPIEQLVLPKDKIIILTDRQLSESEVNIIKQYKIKQICFLIRDTKGIRQAIKLNKIFPDIEMFPFYDNNNISFIKEQVFLSEKDILSNNYNMQYIHRNQILNATFFGKIIILPDGNVLTDFNRKPIGNIISSRFSDIIYEAIFNENSDWFKIRSSLRKCKDCIFQFLCPPISGYEKVLKNSPLCYKNNEAI